VKNKLRVLRRGPKLAVCITMYNENENELKDTLRGVLHNYNELRNDSELGFKKEDLIVFLIADGFERLPASFKKFAEEKHFLKEEVLRNKGFMKQTRDDKWVMKEMEELVDKDCKRVPQNVVHMFQVSTWDFDLEEEELKHRRINFVFAIKQRNDGKINSHKWFFQGLCEHMQPEQCLMLDIGTRPDKHSVYKLYKYMQVRPNCGGCCGEIEVDFTKERGLTGSYFVKAAQFYEYKMGHSPDKANESFFGYNSVLPGAYSMFRWEAIQGQPMKEFFRGLQKEELTCAEAN